MPPKVTAESALLVDAASGKVLYEKRCRIRRPPASLTKIMTAILILEHGNLDDVVTASKHACNTPYGSLHLKPGEKLTLRDLLYAILMRSANDGAVCAAEHIAGSEKKFVAMMNKKAKEIGAMDTHFANPHGLHNANHYSTAYDLALIARYATRYPEFNTIVQTKHARIERSINSLDVTLRNTAKFLSKFEGADGIKTGYTKEAGHCFIGSATRDDWRLISVVLKSKDTWTDTGVLLNYGFKFFKQLAFAKENEVVATVDVLGGKQNKVDLIASAPLAIVVKKTDKVESKVDLDVPKRISAPVKKGEKIGTITAWVNDKKLGTTDLCAAWDVERTMWATAWTWVKTLIMSTFVFLVGIIAYGTAVAKIARRRRRRLAARSGEVNTIRACSRQR
ncbi:MAG: D-alanyl-D-alanine carboxypeptidase family protein [Armatimonadota bacterium]|nr:D-alanyl-D-alanine carboxypeptidase family protein [Armatimonadota bacterium]